MELLDLGIKSYEDVWKLQKELVQKRATQEVSDTLILVEHPHVVTTGRRFEENEILDARFPVVNIERGGRVTYHGPGQLVGYPIIHLGHHHRGVKKYMHQLEAILISVLESYQLVASRKEGATGVWIGEKKIASIGIAVKRWVTYHGFALNVNTDLTAFQSIQPCGFEGSVMTSMQELLGRPIDMSDVKERVYRAVTRLLPRDA